MTDYELQKIVEEISEEVFEKPFLHSVKFNPKLRTTGGRYLLQTNNIEINPKYYQKFGYSELEGIIKHELCHYHLHLDGLGHQHRDQDFKNLISKTKTPRYCTKLKEKKINYIYRCSKCGIEYRRNRMVNLKKYRCGKCREKLDLVKM
ncbi:MAG: hypothetical protein K0R71_723 [Bacillales bacterium]|jgi:SprT-like protein|nr:hypothetical protein [Bacillales bacterium]